MIAHVSCGPQLEAFLVAMLVIFAILIALVALAIKVLIFCKIFSKAGYNWALGLLILVPIANIVTVIYLAFADWPILKELRLSKQQPGR
jgi:magnesium-transporting ATPase (P-type)